MTPFIKYFFSFLPNFILDVLLHEMIHANIDNDKNLKKLSIEIKKKKFENHDHNNKAWIQEINRIGKMIDCIPFKADIITWNKIPKKNKP